MGSIYVDEEIIDAIKEKYSSEDDNKPLKCPYCESKNIYVSDDTGQCFACDSGWLLENDD